MAGVDSRRSIVLTTAHACLRSHQTTPESCAGGEDITVDAATWQGGIVPFVAFFRSEVGSAMSAPFQLPVTTPQPPPCSVYHPPATTLNDPGHSLD
jgi:hypothetical protein